MSNLLAAGRRQKSNLSRMVRNKIIKAIRNDRLFFKLYCHFDSLHRYHLAEKRNLIQDT